MARYDLILHGGRVLDPANGLDGLFDVGIQRGRVESVEAHLDPSLTDHLLDMTGQWVMPGVVDSHVHVSAGGPGSDRA